MSITENYKLESESELDYFLMKNRVDIKSNADLKNYVWTLLDEIKDLEKQNDTLESEGLDYQSTIENLENDILHIEDKYYDEISDLKDEVKAGSENIKTLENDVYCYQDEIKTLKENFIKCKSDQYAYVERLLSEIELLKERV